MALSILRRLHFSHSITSDHSDRGVSFDWDEKALEDEFGDVGPIKSCFLIKPKGQEKHKGFGFVQFALPEDAVRAVQVLNGKAIAGRKLLVRELHGLHGCTYRYLSCMLSEGP